MITQVDWMKFNQPIQSGNSRNISVKNPAFLLSAIQCHTITRLRTCCLQQWRHPWDSVGALCHCWPCPAGPSRCRCPSQVGAPPAPRPQRHAQPRLPGLVVLVEVQSKAQETKALVRTGCQQDQELLDDSLKGKEKHERQLRRHPWCVLHRNIRWCTDLVKRQGESGKRQAQGFLSNS